MVKCITRPAGRMVSGRRALLIVGASLLALQTAPTLAQAADKPVVVADVIVTAQRRVEANIDVPIAITAVGADEIQDIGAGFMTDIAFKAPNVSMSTGITSASISIRGISSQSNINAGFPPAVAVYVDEVYQGRDAMFSTILNDVERVEVLRGPQGTLYGKNTIGGAVNIATVQPSNEFVAFGDLQAGNRDLFQARGTIGGALIEDKLMGRLSLTYRNLGGFLDNTLTGEELNGNESTGARLALASQLTSNIKATLTADYFQQDGTSALETDALVYPPFGPLNPPPTPPEILNLDPQNPYDNIVQLNSPEFAERELYGLSLRFDVEGDGADFVSLTAYRQYRSDFGDDSDGIALDAFNVGREENAENFSQEFRVTSNTEGPLSWIVGAYFYVENIENNRRIRLGEDMPLLLAGTFAGLSLPGWMGEAGRTESTIESSSYALFGSLTYDITERLHLNGGLRWTYEDKLFNYHQYYTQTYGVPTGAVINQFAVAIAPQSESYDDGRLTGDVSLSYDFNDDRVGYVKYSRGFKAGGFQTDVISPPFSLTDDFGFAPETVDNYEAGFKSFWFARRMSLNLAAFYMKWQDKQEQIFTGLSFLIRNAADAHTAGVELELAARPIRPLTLDANLAYLDTEYESFAGNPSAVGKPFAGLPDWTGSAGAQYVTPITGGLDFYARADVIYRGESYSQPNVSTTLKNESLTTWNGRLGVQSSDGRWGAYIWGKNLTDEVVVGGGSAFPFPYAAITTRGPGFGRTYGVELRKKF